MIDRRLLPRRINTVSASSTEITSHWHHAALQSWMQEIAPFGLFTTDADLKIQSWNEWIENHSGLAAPLVIGRSLLHVFPDLAARKMDEHFRRALNGEVVVLSSAFHEYLIPLPTTVREANYSGMQQTVRIAPLMLEGKTRGTIVII